MVQNSIETTLRFPHGSRRSRRVGSVTFRDLPEAISYGANRSDAETMAAEVLELGGGRTHGPRGGDPVG